MKVYSADEETFPVFTKEQLIAANDWAINMEYNRALEPKPLKEHLSSFDENTKFPVVYHMLHEHAGGVKVDPHIRCQISLGMKGPLEFIDVDFDLFNSLEQVTVPESN
jgi:hypothetical protein